MLPHPQQVTKIIQRVAKTIIMPRFRQLKDNQISEKSPGDFVTIADLESEKFLKRYLVKLVPGSIVVGEEEVESSPKLLEHLMGNRPVWVLDPLDGTGNFANGRKPFVVIVAFCHNGETLMGWIHDPQTGETIWAGKGLGCWVGGKRLKLPYPPALKDMTGSLSKRYAERIQAIEGGPQYSRRIGCVGRDYIDLVLGNLNFARYSFHLKPWDHAAGALIHSEAGGHNCLIKAAKSYYPALMPAEVITNKEVMILAPNMDTIEVITSMLTE